HSTSFAASTNGQPSLWAYLFDHLDLVPGKQVLHLGCGTGYYTAIIAELVGSAGRVTAVEIDATLSRKGQAAFADWPQVRVIHGDGAGTFSSRSTRSWQVRAQPPVIFMARRT